MTAISGDDFEEGEVADTSDYEENLSIPACVDEQHRATPKRESKSHRKRGRHHSKSGKREDSKSKRPRDSYEQSPVFEQNDVTCYDYYDSPQHHGPQHQHYAHGAQRSLVEYLSDDEIDFHTANLESKNKTKSKSDSKKKKKKFKKRDWPYKTKKPILDKSRPRCRYFMEGRCNKGDSCPFSHDFIPPKKQDLCKFYATGICAKGQNCLFLHDEYPCKFFHMNKKCSHGDSCKFSHAPLTAETKAMLDRQMNEMAIDEHPDASDKDDRSKADDEGFSNRHGDYGDYDYRSERSSIGAHPLQRYPHGPNSGSGFGGPHCLHDEPAGIDTMNGGSGSDHIRDGQRHHFLDNDDRLRDPSAQTGYLGGPRFSGGLPHRMPFGRPVGAAGRPPLYQARLPHGNGRLPPPGAMMASVTGADTNGASGPLHHSRGFGAPIHRPGFSGLPGGAGGVPSGHAFCFPSNPPHIRPEAHGARPPYSGPQFSGHPGGPPSRFPYRPSHVPPPGPGYYNQHHHHSHHQQSGVRPCMISNGPPGGFMGHGQGGPGSPPHPGQTEAAAANAAKEALVSSELDKMAAMLALSAKRDSNSVTTSGGLNDSSELGSQAQSHATSGSTNDLGENAPFPNDPRRTPSVQRPSGKTPLSSCTGLVSPSRPEQFELTINSTVATTPATVVHPAHSVCSPPASDPLSNLALLPVVNHHAPPLAEIPWRLISLEAIFKIPYQLMQLQVEDLPHRFDDPRLRGHLTAAALRPLPLSSVILGTTQTTTVVNTTPSGTFGISPPPEIGLGENLSSCIDLTISNSIAGDPRVKKASKYDATELNASGETFSDPLPVQIGPTSEFALPNDRQLQQQTLKNRQEQMPLTRIDCQEHLEPRIAQHQVPLSAHTEILQSSPYPTTQPTGNESRRPFKLQLNEMANVFPGALKSSSSILGPASLLSGSPSISGVGVLSAGTGVSGIGATGAGLTRVFGDRSYLADPRFRRRRIATVTSPTPASSRDAETNETSSDELKMLSKVNDFGLDASASSLSSLSPTLPNKECSSATQTSTSDNPTGLNYSSGSNAVSVVR